MQSLVFTGFSPARGGIPRVVVNLMNALAASGMLIEAALPPGECEDAQLMDARIRLSTVPGGLAGVWRWWRRLRREPPLAIVSNRERGRPALLVARALAGARTRIVFRIGNPVSIHIARRRGHKRWIRGAAIRWTYPRADALIVNSRALATDVVNAAGVAASRVHVLANPTIGNRLEAQGTEASGHPWLDAGPRACPVVLGVGRLAPQKDFATLIRAVARIAPHRPLRLIIVGEGKERERLRQLAGDLGIGENVDLPGFVTAPAAWMARADVFALSSRWEGSPNVLIEALALGCPCVATRCPTGPDEILENGRYGPLVPVGDDDALARALEAVLDNPLPADTLRAAAAPFREDIAAAAYARVLGVDPEPASSWTPT